MTSPASAAAVAVSSLARSVWKHSASSGLPAARPFRVRLTLLEANQLSKIGIGAFGHLFLFYMVFEKVGVVFG